VETAVASLARDNGGEVSPVPVPFPLRYTAFLVIAALAMFIAGCGDRAPSSASPPPTRTPEREARCAGSRFAGCLEAEHAILPTGSCDEGGFRVCLVPLGRVPPELMQHLVDYYATQHQLQVTVSRPAAIPSEILDPARADQVDAPTLADYLEALVPGAFADLSTTIIGITPVDVYDANADFPFIFGIKGTIADRRAIISTFRFNPETFGAPANDDLLYARTRKFLSKYIGLLYYGLPISQERGDPMYDPIVSLDQLDEIREPLQTP
jgi:predicted Zn-dependent protease